MANKTMIKVNGSYIKTPSAMVVSIQDISDSDAGRTMDGLMHKNRVARKRKISFTWAGVSKSDAHDILSAFKDEYFNVTYYDPWANATQTRRFYSGDQTAPVKTWTANNKIYESISLDVVER